NVDDLNVRSGPGPDHDVVGQVDNGDLVLTPYGFHPDRWAQVIGDEIAGYVNAGTAEAPFLLRVPTPWNAYTAALVGVASNGSDYLAYGYGSMQDHQILGGDPTSVLLFSEDGESWAPVAAPPPAVHGLSGGPDGWVALSFGHGGTTFVTFSPDGRTWEGSTMRPGSSVAHGPGGWVITNSNLLFRSADGRNWDEVIELGATTALTAIAGSDSGYVAYERGGRRLMGSRDGVNWTDVTLPTAAWIADVDLVGDRVLALFRSEGSGVSTVQRGILEPSGTVAWDESAPGAVVGDAYRIHSVAVGPEGLLALGWNIADLTPASWSSPDGDEWTRLNLAGDALGGSVTTTPAWGAGGWITLGTAPEGAGPAPHGGIIASGTVLAGAAQALWASTDGESWEPTATVAYDGATPPCPPAAEVTTLVLMYLGSLAGECLGDASMTVTGWVPDIQGLGGCCWPIADPQWLAGPYPGGFLAPARTTEPIASLLLYLPPGVSFPASEPGTKLEVIGHFGDAAAAICRRTPDDDLAYYLEAPRVTRSDCAARFVVESVTVIEGP
ncbi:MAG TPA: SH3 domain-containing protein, partial [Candidatus Limnocylindria bacterium]